MPDGRSSTRKPRLAPAGRPPRAPGGGQGAPAPLAGDRSFGAWAFIRHLGRAHRRPAFGPGPGEGAPGAAIRERPVLRRPFGTLMRLAARAPAAAHPRVLLVAPLSGHYPTLLRDTAAALLPDHEVFVTDWADAAAVPPGEGRFGFEEMIAYLITFLRRLGPGTHLVGVCQSGTPALATAALMAEAGDPARPRSLTLMGGLIDTGINPTRMNRMARSRPFAWFEPALVSMVPLGFPGAGRRVYATHLQLAGLVAYLVRRARPGGSLLETFQARLVGDGTAPADQQRLYDEFLTLMDLPAELYLETLRHVLRERTLPRGRLTWRGRRVNPAAIRDIALLTVEGARDDISAPGQTRAAHRLCVNLPARRRAHHEEPEVGHLGLFHGRRWRANVLPVVRDFVRRHA